MGIVTDWYRKHTDGAQRSSVRWVGVPLLVLGILACAYEACRVAGAP